MYRPNCTNYWGTGGRSSSLRLSCSPRHCSCSWHPEGGSFCPWHCRYGWTLSRQILYTGRLHHFYQQDDVGLCHQPKGRGYGHTIVLKFCRLSWCVASRGFVSDSWAVSAFPDRVSNATPARLQPLDATPGLLASENLSPSAITWRCLRDSTFNRSDTILACDTDRHTDRQTDRQTHDGGYWFNTRATALA